MARNFTTNLILAGNAQGGLAALRTVQGELNRTERSGGKLRREFQELSRRGQVLQQGMVRLGGALAAAFSVGAAVRGIQQLTAEADGIAKTARNIGITGEALQELRGAGELSGLAINQVDDALRRFNRRLGLFIQDGGGPAAKAIERLNLQVQDSTGKFIGVEAALDQAIDAIARLPTVAEQAAAASELFGEDAGPKLVTLLQQGSEGVKELREQIRATGSVMSDEATVAAERFSDQLTLLGRQTKGIAVGIFDGLIPALAGTFEAFQQVQREGDGLTNVGEQIGRAFNVIIRAGIVVRETMLAIGEVIVGLAVTVVGAVQQIAAPLTGFLESAQQATQALLDRDFKAAAAAVSGIGRQIATDFEDARLRTDRGLGFIGESVETRVQNAVESVARIAAGLDDAGEQAEQSGREFDEWAISADGAGQAAEGAAGKTQQWADRIADLEARMGGPLAQAIRELQRDTQAVVAAFNAGELSGDQLNQMLDLLQQRFETTADTIGQKMAAELERLAFSTLPAVVQQMLGLVEATQQVADAGSGFGNIFSQVGSGFAQSIFAGQSIGDSLASAFTGAGGAQVGRGLEQIFADAAEAGFGQALSNSRTVGNIAGGIALGIGQIAQGNTGQGIGQLAGTIIGSFAPVIGPIIGGLIGSLVGGLFGGGSVPKFQVRGTRPDRAIDEGTDVTTFTRFGQLDFAFREIEAEAQATVIRGFLQFDGALAMAIRDADRRTAVAEALEEFAVSSRADGEDLGTLLQDRFDLALSAFEPAVRAAVQGVGTTLEEQIQRLADSEAIRAATDRLQGIGLGFEEALALVAELEQPGEGLAAAFLRLRAGITGLEEVIGALGGELIGSRAAALEYVDALSTAAGGIDELTRLFDRFNSTFVDSNDLLGAQIDAARGRAGGLLAGLGLDEGLVDDRDAFRQAFADLLPTLDPADAAVLLQAADAIADVIDLEAELARAREQALQPLRDLASLQAQAATALLTFDLNDFQSAIVQIRIDGIAAAQALEDAAAATGMQVDITGDLANVTELTARRIAAAIQQLEQVGRGLAEQLFGTELSRLDEEIAALQDGLGGTADGITQVAEATTAAADASAQAAVQLRRFADSLLIGNLSPLNSGDRLDEAFRQLQDASARGDASGVQSLANSVLQIGRERFASGQEFSELFAEVQRIIRGTTPASDRPQPVTIVGAPGISVGVSPELEALLARRAELEAEQQAQQDALLANQLAQVIADIGAEDERTFAQIAQALGFDLDQLADVLGLDLAGLETFIASLQVDTQSTAGAIATMEAALFDELVVQSDLLREIRDGIGPVDFGGIGDGELPPGAGPVLPPVDPPPGINPPGSPPIDPGINPPMAPRELVEGIAGTTTAVQQIGGQISGTIEGGNAEVVLLLRRIANELERTSGTRGNTRVAV